MSWALHYEITLERALSSDEVQALERLSERRSYSLQRVGADFRGFIELASVGQLCRVVAWLQEVEKLLPVATFEISEDSSITKECRPSEVDLAALLRKAERESEELEGPEEAEDPEVEALLEEGLALRAEKIEVELARARKDFAIWKNAQQKQ